MEGFGECLPILLDCILAFTAHYIVSLWQLTPVHLHLVESYTYVLVTNTYIVVADYLVK